MCRSTNKTDRIAVSHVPTDEHPSDRRVLTLEGSGVIVLTKSVMKGYDDVRTGGSNIVVLLDDGISGGEAAKIIEAATAAYVTMQQLNSTPRYDGPQ